MSLLTIISVVFGVFSGVVNLRRNKTKDDKSEASELTTLLIKFENIQKDLYEIKSDIRNDIKAVKEENKQNTEKMIRLDESLKSAWNAINKLQDRCDDGK